MISVIGPFYNPKKAFTYMFHKIGDSFPGYKKDMYHFYGFGFEASNKSNALLFRDMKRYFGSSDEEWGEIKFNYTKALRGSKVFDNFYRKHSAKKNHKYDVSHDLNMEPLENHRERMKIKLLHEGTEYEFVIRDLLRIIKNSLLSNDDLHVDPKFPKNPYNNIVFSKENMYKLFVTMKMRNYIIPDIFLLFIRYHMNLPYFLVRNECYIRNLCIEDYHTQFSKPDLFEEIIIMLRTVRPANMYIHISYPDNEIIEKMTPFLTLYWHSIHNILSDERIFYKKQFHFKLNKFMKENTVFGRIIRSKKNPLPEDIKKIDNEYKITNYLSEEIPYYLSTLTSIKDFMREGTIYHENRNIVNAMDISDESASDMELVD